MLSELWHLYHKVVQLANGHIWLVDIGVTDMQFYTYLRNNHNVRRPIALICTPVTQEYWDTFKDGFEESQKFVTADMVGADAPADANGDW